ncbi:DUF1684 domain-containing protein [Angustibacter aerolatus]|uniref:DUF1684 domain-containing protein n=1 Tax=Angustibacter aerolatus TaxID=1162965 RepID=A0ABQ6JJI6_9ACTN|nr:DUF1684 domain-containing protein [Angustibacter aerolatus]GMA87721.1 hypothetical protein GCM10025868_29710 [Angustibacter aerolatus]
MPHDDPTTAADPASYPQASTVLAVVDWRRRVHALYRAVRERSPLEGHALWVTERDDLFAHHPASPLLPEHRAGFTGLDVAPYDERYRFEVPIEPVVGREEVEGADVFDAATATDGTVPFRRLGEVRLDTVGGEVVLDVWRLGSYGGGLFLPMRDGTSGSTSYGAGRYLLDTVKGSDLGPGASPDTVVVDLNFAYNPSCAYDPAWSCPLAPAGNRTPVDVPVGEQNTGPWAED